MSLKRLLNPEVTDDEVANWRRDEHYKRRMDPVPIE